MSMQRAPCSPGCPDLAHTAKVAAGWRCAACGAFHGSLAVSKQNQFYRVVLAACHVDSAALDPASGLVVYCQACHLRYGAFQRWRTRRRHVNERAIAAGQLQWTDDVVSPDEQRSVVCQSA